MHCPTIFSFLLLCGAVISTPVAVRVPSKYATLPYDISSKRAKTDGYRAVGYFGNWDIYARNYFITDVPASQLTHLVYSFANVNSTTGEVFMTDEWADLQYSYPGDSPDTAPANTTNVYGNIKQMYLLKKQNRSLKTLLAILGWTYSPNMIPVLASPTLRANFVSSSVSLMTNLGFDGLDIDYEYISNSTEAANMVSLLKDIRQAMDSAATNGTSPYILSYASPAGPARYSLMDFKGMDQYLDFWNFMGYDYAGNWDTLAGHSSNLFGDKSNPSSTPFNTSSAIDYYLKTGCVAPSKINLGMPLYARSFSNTAGPGQPFNNTGAPGSFGESSTWDTKALPLPGSNATVYNLKKIGASYSYDASSKLMISYDTPTMAKVKASWIEKMGLGGAMWWEVSQDKSGKDSLIATVVKTFGGEKRLDRSLNRLEYPDSKYDNLRNGMPNN
ncbi:glycoside hydrolase family 18 protein [Cadophora sp. DSE1049]|nr:glycoside hydrolase family 18 protein [Cadophora sp. DSE1049]